MKKIIILWVMLLVLVGCFANNKEVEKSTSWNLESWKDELNNKKQQDFNKNININKPIIPLKDYMNEDWSINKNNYETYSIKRIDEIKNELGNLKKEDLIIEENKIKKSWNNKEPTEIKKLNEILQIDRYELNNIDCNYFIMDSTKKYCFYLKDEFKKYIDLNKLTK